MTIINTIETINHGKAQILNLVYLLSPSLCSAVFKTLAYIIYTLSYTF